MKDLPILFSPILAAANRANWNENTQQIKTQTRRVSGLQEVNKAPDQWDLLEVKPNMVDGCMAAAFRSINEDRIITLNCPYGMLGTVLYIREQFYTMGHWQATGRKTKTGKAQLQFVSTRGLRFNDNPPPVYQTAKEVSEEVEWHRRPGLFLPKEHSKQFVMVRSIRVERLQAISEADAIQEGIELMSWEPIARGYTYRDYETYPNDPGYGYGDFPTLAYPIDSFQSLINYLHKGNLWNQNPWVWVVDYMPISSHGRPEVERIEDVACFLQENPEYEWSKGQSKPYLKPMEIRLNSLTD